MDEIRYFWSIENSIRKTALKGSVRTIKWTMQKWSTHSHTYEQRKNFAYRRAISCSGALGRLWPASFAREIAVARYPGRTKISHTHSKVISQTSASTCCDSFCCRCVNNAARNILDTCCGHATDDAAGAFRREKKSSLSWRPGPGISTGPSLVLRRAKQSQCRTR